VENSEEAQFFLGVRNLLGVIVVGIGVVVVVIIVVVACIISVADVDFCCFRVAIVIIVWQ